MNLQQLFGVFFALIILVVACKPEQAPEAYISGIDISLMDTNATPANDFYNYVNGAWMEKTEIPADRTRWGSFDELRKNTNENVQSILNSTMDNNEYPQSSDQYKAISFFKSGMDENSINKAGIKPLEPMLNQLASIENTNQVQQYIESTSAYGETGFFDFGVFPDLKNSEINAPYLGPGFLGLPERDYYLKEDEESQNIRDKYVQHISNVFSLAGIEEDDQMAEGILALETSMAENMLSKEKRRNPTNLYHKYAISELKEITPSINWSEYFEALGADQLDTVIVTEPDYFKALENIFAEGNIRGWKSYLYWSMLQQASPFLSSDFEEENFAFYEKELNGTEEMKPRWERVLAVANNVIGEAIGKLYVDEYFPPEAKQKAEEMVDDILMAFEGRIQQLDWMTPETKEKALEKLSSFNVKIAYPDEWKDYADLDITGVEEGGTYIENMMKASKWNFTEEVSKLGKEVDETEWFMPPQIVNAYYNPLFNEIVFPAAILQPPFYNYKADLAVNYGGIGAVIGHEVSHGFDDQGSRFDAEGNMNNWWTDDDRKSFEERNQKLIEQYNAYEALPGVFVNGEFTLGENIGDLGGLNVAYDALQIALGREGRPGPIDGLTPEQRFFVSWATIWRGKIREEALKTRIKTDPHSPGYFRAVGPLSNMESFYAAFDVDEGDELYRPDSLRVKIW